MEALFRSIADELDGAVGDGEVYLATFAAEDTDFVRFNNGKVRQPGSVRQADLSLELIRGQRHASSGFTLSGDAQIDRDRTLAAVAELRALLDDVPDDPYLLYSTEVRSSATRRSGRIPGREQVVGAVIHAARSLDFAGIYAGGKIYRGFANSFGQRNWHEVENFNLDCSFHHRADRAVKTAYAGTEWSDAELASRLDRARDHFERLKAPARTLEPGSYSAYLAPAAMDELLDMLSWGGFSEKQRRVKQSPLQRLYDVLLPGGKLLLFVPADQALYGTMDEQVGHFRRYSREQLEQLIEAAGFTSEQVVYQNVYGRFGWWLNGRILRRSHVPAGQSRIFDLMVPLMRRLEGKNPSKGLSLVAVAAKPKSEAEARHDVA